MSLGKQAKTLSKGAVLGYLAKTRWPTRNRVIFLSNGLDRLMIEGTFYHQSIRFLGDPMEFRPAGNGSASALPADAALFSYWL
jgi:hypothetical protein